jgi:hypothetical protein
LFDASKLQQQHLMASLQACEENQIRIFSQNKKMLFATTSFVVF